MLIQTTEQPQQQPESHLWGLHSASADAAPEESSPGGRFTRKRSNKADVLILRCEVLVTVPTIPIPGGHVKEKLTPGGRTKKHTP